MTDLDEHDRPQPPVDGDEAATLMGFLNYQRATLAWKCRGVSAEGMRATIGASTMTLGGLLKHLAYVEDDWSHRGIVGTDRPEPWEDVDWAADQDWEWNTASNDTPAELFEFWERSVDRSQRIIDDTLATASLDQPGARTWPDGRSPSIRWILVHLIEEYARHNGHADLIRETIDGATGE